MVLLLASSSACLALGAAAGWFAARRGPRTPPFVALGPGVAPSLPAGLPPPGDDQAIWQVPAPEQVPPLFATLAEALGQQRLVLLVPRPASRASLAARLGTRPGLLWLEEDRPSCARLLDAASALPATLRPLLLVEGAEALEPVGEGEPSDAAVEELLDDAELPVLVLMSERDRLPRAPALRWRGDVAATEP